MSPVSVCELLVGGMTCTACTGAVHGALTKKPGVLRANVDILRETARVAYHSDIIAPEELCGVIQSLGFEAEILQIFAPSDPSSDDSRTTADWTDPSIGVQKSELGGPLPPQQAISADPEDRQTAALPLAFQKTTAGNYDYSDLVNKSKATIRLAIHESEGLSAESACSSLESINGVLSCAVTPINGFNVNGAKQLIVTYKPNVVGVRDLFIKLMRRGFNPSLLAEDPLETQKDAVLENQKTLLSSLLLSLFPALAVVCLSIMARTHSLPAPLSSEFVPGIRVSTFLLLLLCTPVQFYGGRTFHLSALKGLRHGHFSMDLLVSLGSNMAYFYSVLSCIQLAATIVGCQQLLPAGDVAAAANHVPNSSADFAKSPFYEILEEAEPQVFLDTCAMLVCVVLFGKVLQLRAKARILKQLHSLHSLKTPSVHLVLRSKDSAVASYLLKVDQWASCIEGEDSAGPSDIVKLSQLSTDCNSDVMQQPPSLSWWQRLAFLLTFQHPVHKYNPLTQAGPLSFDDEVELTSESKPRGLQTEETGEATNGSENEGAEGFPDEVMINTDLLQMGDVVRVPPHEVLPADGILLAPDVLHVDERLVSGEGRGVAKLAGQRVIGGSRNASHADAYIKVEVIGDASVLQTLLRLVNTGQQQQPPLQKAAETFAAYFIPVVLCITTVAVISWTVKVFGAADTLPLSPLQQMKQRLIELEQSEGIASRQRSLMLQRLHLEQQRQQHIESYGNFLRASGSLPPPSVSIVDATSVDDHAAAAAAAAACRLSGWVVTWDSLLFALRFGVAVCCAACPCAIGLAAPAAVAAATAAAAARGVFFKTGKSLETAAKTSLLVVDKTGTLTTGELRVAACVFHSQRLREFLLPAMKQMGISPTPLHRNKLESEASDYTGCGAVSTELPKRPSCCGSSISNNTRCTENMSPSDTLHGSMTSDITAEEAPTSSIYAAGDSELKLLPACQTLPNYSESGSQTGRQECTSSAAAMSCEGGLAFFRFSHLWALPSKRSEECTGRSSSTACSGDGSGNCCADLLRKQQQELAGMESSPGTHANYQILDSTAGELEAGCVLWALSCLEQGSSHAVGLALVGAYDRWRRRYNSGEAEGIRTVKNIVEEPEELNRQFPPPRPCENVLMLQRGIEGSMPITEGLYLRLRVAAASPEDSESDGRRSQQCQTKGISSSDVFQLEEWTSWHESHNGPVVNLHASVSSAASRDAQLEWVWLGSVALQDEVERETKVAVDYLRQCMGFKVFMCTGDNPRTAARVAAALEIPESCVMAQQTPEGKVSFLRSLVSEDTSGATTESTAYSSSSTASSGIRPNSSSSYLSLITRQHKKPPICCMVGDGLNDSPALAEAALGVAFGVGNALPLAAAAVAVGGQSWTELVDLFRIARQTQSIIRWNFLWACAFNLVAVPLAAGVAYPTVSVHPAAAAAAMAGSCLLVLLNAQRLTRFKATTTESMELELSRLSPTIQTERQSVEKRELEDFASEESPKSDISLQLRDDYPSSHRVLDDDIIFASINAPVVPAGFGCQVGLAAGAIGPLELPVSDSDSPFFDDLLQFEGQDSMSC